MTERFTLLSELGRGGMGVVWKARDEETGQTVALKLLRETYAEDPEYVTRFERELDLAKRIHSRNVISVLGYGVRDRTPYLALEYVDGPSLRQLLITHGPYAWPEASALVAQIAQGLADAHAAGVVHRDLKPSNVLVGSDGVAKLADFGIAKGLDLTRVTGTSTMLGTPAYLPPEGPADARSDLYSLGVIAYELLSGVVPFEGRTYQEVILRHVREVPDLRKLPAEAQPIVGWLLAKDPADRPQSATVLLDALEGRRSAPMIAAPTGGPAAPFGQYGGQTGPSGLAAGDRDRARTRRRPAFGAILLGIALVVAVGSVAAVGAAWSVTRTSSASSSAAGGVPTSGPFMSSHIVADGSSPRESLAPLPDVASLSPSASTPQTIATAPVDASLVTIGPARTPTPPPAPTPTFTPPPTPTPASPSPGSPSPGSPTPGSPTPGSPTPTPTPVMFVTFTLVSPSPIASGGYAQYRELSLQGAFCYMSAHYVSGPTSPAPADVRTVGITLATGPTYLVTWTQAFAAGTYNVWAVCTPAGGGPAVTSSSVSVTFQ